MKKKIIVFTVYLLFLFVIAFAYSLAYDRVQYSSFFNTYKHLYHKEMSIIVQPEKPVAHTALYLLAYTISTLCDSPLHNSETA